MDNLPSQNNNIQDEPVVHLKNKHLPVMVLLVLISLVVGFALGYFINQINTLSKTETEINTSHEIVDTKAESEKEVLEPEKSEVLNTASDIDLPAIAFTPDTFSEAEKEALYIRLINPLVDWEVETLPTDRQLVSMSIQKLTNHSLAYRYQVDFVYTNGGWGGFLYSQATGEDYPLWTPSCFAGCEFSDSYKKKHPEVVQKVQESE